MSALRQLFAAAWASIWMHWRLASLRARQLFGSAPAPAGPGYHLPAAEIPVEGIDYELADLPPELVSRLEATRADLLDRARTTTDRSTRRRRVRRRRAASLAMAALLTLAVLGASATALVTGSTGVPAVDRLLGIHEAGLDKPDASGQLGPTGRELQPRSSGESRSIGIPFGDGSQRLVTSFYVARDGQVCSGITDARGPDRGSLGSIACVPPTLLGESLAEDGVYLSTNTQADSIVLRGYLRRSAINLDGRGPSGALDVRLGESWVPGVPGLGSLTPFVAVTVNGNHGKDSEGADLQDLDPRRYVFDVQTDDGHHIRVPR